MIVGAGRGGDDDDRSEFRRSLPGVKPLSPGKRRPEPPPRLPTPRPADDAEPVRFEIERRGAIQTGRASGTERRRVK